MDLKWNNKFPSILNGGFARGGARRTCLAKNEIQ